MIRQAVILAAGEGQRLQPFTARKPKVMIEVANQPILEYVVRAVRGAGIFDIIMVVGYHRERVMDYFGDGSRFGVKIRYVVQEQQLGTAHALKEVKEMVEGAFVVLPGDNIIDAASVGCALEPWTLVYQVVANVSKYGVVVLDDGRVSSIVEKPDKEAVSHLVNTGIYALREDIFDEIGDETSLVAVLTSLLGKFEFVGVENQGVWMDMVYPWDILRLNDLAMRSVAKQIAGKIEKNVTIIGDVRIGAKTVIRGNTYIKGPVVVGEGCDIGPNTVIMPSTTIDDNVVIGSHAYIADSVINKRVILAPGSFVERSVLDRGCVVGSRFTASNGLTELKIGEEWCSTETGVFIGEDCEIGSNVVCEPGTIIGNKSSISSTKHLQGRIPDQSTVL